MQEGDIRLQDEPGAGFREVQQQSTEVTERAQPGETESTSPSCPGTTRFGRPCRATPTRDGRCPNHSQRFTAADRSAWGRRGGEKMLQKRMLKEVVAEAPIFPLRVAVEYLPCHFETARRTLRRFKHQFAPPSYSVVKSRRVRVVSATDIRTLRRIVLGNILRSLQRSK
jgi:hypothetical protein